MPVRTLKRAKKMNAVQFRYPPSFLHVIGETFHPLLKSEGILPSGNIAVSLREQGSKDQSHLASCLTKKAYVGLQGSSGLRYSQKSSVLHIYYLTTVYLLSIFQMVQDLCRIWNMTAHNGVLQSPEMYSETTPLCERHLSAGPVFRSGKEILGLHICGRWACVLSCNLSVKAF